MVSTRDFVKILPTQKFDLNLHLCKWSTTHCLKVLQVSALYKNHSININAAAQRYKGLDWASNSKLQMKYKVSLKGVYITGYVSMSVINNKPVVGFVRNSVNRCFLLTALTCSSVFLFLSFLGLWDSLSDLLLTLLVLGQHMHTHTGQTLSVSVRASVNLITLHSITIPEDWIVTEFMSHCRI